MPAPGTVPALSYPPQSATVVPSSHFTSTCGFNQFPKLVDPPIASAASFVFHNFDQVMRSIRHATTVNRHCMLNSSTPGERSSGADQARVRPRLVQSAVRFHRLGVAADIKERAIVGQSTTSRRRSHKRCCT